MPGRRRLRCVFSISTWKPSSRACRRRCARTCSGSWPSQPPQTISASRTLIRFSRYAISPVARPAGIGAGRAQRLAIATMPRPSAERTNASITSSTCRPARRSPGAAGRRDRMRHVGEAEDAVVAVGIECVGRHRLPVAARPGTARSRRRTGSGRARPASPRCRRSRSACAGAPRHRSSSRSAPPRRRRTEHRRRHGRDLDRDLAAGRGPLAISARLAADCADRRRPRATGPSRLTRSVR